MINKKNKYTGIIAILILGLAMVYYFNRDEEVRFSEPRWNCECLSLKCQCTVSFEITNVTNTHQTRKVSIRAVKVPYMRKYQSFEICGEKFLDIELSPKEIININETFNVSGRPDEVKINIWK